METEKDLKDSPSGPGNPDEELLKRQAGNPDEELLKRQDRYTKYMLKRYPLIYILYGVIGILGVAVLILILYIWIDHGKTENEFCAVKSNISVIDKRVKVDSTKIVAQGKRICRLSDTVNIVREITGAIIDSVTSQSHCLKKVQKKQKVIIIRVAKLERTQKSQVNKQVQQQHQVKNTLDSLALLAKSQKDAISFLMANAPRFDSSQVVDVVSSPPPVAPSDQTTKKSCRKRGVQPNSYWRYRN